MRWASNILTCPPHPSASGACCRKSQHEAPGLTGWEKTSTFCAPCVRHLLSLFHCPIVIFDSTWGEAMKDFRGKTAFITGGASGIGFALARAFGREGAQVALADIDFDAARYAVERLDKDQIKAVPIRCDVGERHSLERAALETLATFGKVHILCNNAGVAVGGPLGTVT